MLTASIKDDFPDPFGPTSSTSLTSRAMSVMVVSVNLLKLLSLISFIFMARSLFAIRYNPPILEFGTSAKRKVASLFLIPHHLLFDFACCVFKNACGTGVS
jgi:hypothetical protein